MTRSATARLQLGLGYSPATARLQPGYSPATAWLQPGYSQATATSRLISATHLISATARLQPGYSPATARLPRPRVMFTAVWKYLETEVA